MFILNKEAVASCLPCTNLGVKPSGNRNRE